MDPRDRANVLLSRANAREGVVTPDNMISPMDAANTQKIPRSVVEQADTEQEADNTTVLSSSVITDNDYRSALDAAVQPVSEQHEEPTFSNFHETQETQVDGLVPTSRTPPAQSYLARRLEGL